MHRKFSERACVMWVSESSRPRQPCILLHFVFVFKLKNSSHVCAFLGNGKVRFPSNCQRVRTTVKGTRVQLSPDRLGPRQCAYGSQEKLKRLSWVLRHREATVVAAVGSGSLGEENGSALASVPPEAPTAIPGTMSTTQWLMLDTGWLFRHAHESGWERFTVNWPHRVRSSTRPLTKVQVVNSSGLWPTHSAAVKLRGYAQSITRRYINERGRPCLSHSFPDPVCHLDSAAVGCLS